MSLSKRLFRESALERLSSPEQLDQQLQVTSAKGWIALAAIWTLLVAVVVWSIVGSVPTKEEGQGIIVVGGGLKVVVAPSTGRLAAINIEVKDVIDAGQAVAVIDKPEIRDELEETRSQLRDLQTQNRRLDEFDAREEALQADLAKREKERLQQFIDYATQRLKRLRDQHVTVTGLVDDGMMTPIDRHNVEEDIEQTELDQVKALLDMEQIDNRNSEAAFGRERARMKRDFELEKLQGKVAMLESRFERESQVISQVEGRVVEVRAAEHTTVAEGDPILLLEPTDAEATGELEAILYVSAATGKRVRPDMDVHISPSTVKREEYGSMLGRVMAVADGPTSKPAMLARLSDVDLVEKLTQETGLPLQVNVALITTEATFSGFAWTSSEGPPTRISAGTLCSGSVTVKEQRPVELLIPFIKKKLGFAE